MTERDTAEFRALIEQYVAALDELVVVRRAGEQLQKQQEALEEQRCEHEVRASAARRLVRDCEDAIREARGLE